MKVVALAFAWLVSATVAEPASAASCSVRREATSLALHGFTSPAELVRPPAGSTVVAVAVLFQGSDVADLDGTIVGNHEGVISRPMRQVADHLACAGVASLRYNKRYVTSASTAEQEKFDGLTGADLADDGRTAVAAVRSHADLAGLPLALVGWSEGTTVAMAVAAGEPSVRALVLMSPVVDSPAHVAQAQYQRVGRPYLAHFARDGALDADAISRAEAGPGGVLAHIFVRMFRGFRPGERVNALLDANKDGRITFAEADPVITSWYADGPDSGLGMSASGRALKGVASAYGPSTPPILILQGLNDSMIGPEAARSFAEHAGKGRVTLKTYPGLGHSLGPAPSLEADALAPTASNPLSDMATWLRRTVVCKRTSSTARCS